MHSSTFNSERELPALPWARTFSVAIFIFLSIAIAFEINLAYLGYFPTIADSPDKWIEQRARVDNLGKHGLILVGASRGIYGIDIDVLRNKTGMEPVQLGIEGNSFLPVLENLANDPAATGTVMVEYQPEWIDAEKPKEYVTVSAWVKKYEKERKRAWWSRLSLSGVEKKISELLHENLLVYSENADPLLSLQFRILPQAKLEVSFMTRPDRSVIGNFKIGNAAPGGYRRAARRMKLNGITGTESDVEQRLEAKLSTLQPLDPTLFLENTEQIKLLITRIEANGGHVIFVAMPTSGFLRKADDKFYPQGQFLDAFERITGKTVLVSNTTPKLKDFICPDGSHLDMRDRTQFTSELVDALKAAKQL